MPGATYPNSAVNFVIIAILYLIPTRRTLCHLTYDLFNTRTRCKSHPWCNFVYLLLNLYFHTLAFLPLVFKTHHRKDAHMCQLQNLKTEGAQHLSWTYNLLLFNQTELQFDDGSTRTADLIPLLRMSNVNPSTQHWVALGCFHNMLIVVFIICSLQSSPQFLVNSSICFSLQYSSPHSLPAMFFSHTLADSTPLLFWSHCHLTFTAVWSMKFQRKHKKLKALGSLKPESLINQNVSASFTNQTPEFYPATVDIGTRCPHRSFQC